MQRKERSRLVVGVLLLAVGIYFLAAQFYPALGDWINIEFSWPLIVIGVGVFLLVIGLLSGEPDMAVPACIVGGIGGILYFQNLTGRWETWAYVWTLIPGFIGVGMLLSALLGGRSRGDVSGGVWMLVISAVLFLIFGSFLGNLQLAATGRLLAGAADPLRAVDVRPRHFPETCVLRERRNDATRNAFLGCDHHPGRFFIPAE
jgi:hypothetical protein